MDAVNIAMLIELGREERSVEFKRSAGWDEVKHKIAKTAMAMANKRDGGVIIIGADESNPHHVAQGITTEHRATFDADNIKAFINKYADPYVDVDVLDVEHNGKPFLAIAVREFDLVPVICKKGGTELRDGALYIRSYRMTESCEPHGQTDMREIVELAVEKGVRRYLQQTQRVGIAIETLGPGADAVAFERQLRSAEAHKGAVSVSAVAHWKITLRPNVFEAERIAELGQCRDIVRSSQVRWRGWAYPRIDSNGEESLNDSIASGGTRSDGRREYWQLFQSGLFVHMFSMWEDTASSDFRERVDGIDKPQGFKPSGFVDFVRALDIVTQAFEFAARLAQKGVLEDGLSVTIELVGMRDRLLLSIDPMRWWTEYYPAKDDVLSKTWNHSASDLLSASSELALDAAVWLFQRFNWTDVPRSFLADEQRKLIPPTS